MVRQRGAALQYKTDFLTDPCPETGTIQLNIEVDQNCHSYVKLASLVRPCHGLVIILVLRG